MSSSCVLTPKNTKIYEDNNRFCRDWTNDRITSLPRWLTVASASQEQAMRADVNCWSSAKLAWHCWPQQQLITDAITDEQLILGSPLLTLWKTMGYFDFPGFINRQLSINRQIRWLACTCQKIGHCLSIDCLFGKDGIFTLRRPAIYNVENNNFAGRGRAQAEDNTPLVKSQHAESQHFLFTYSCVHLLAKFVRAILRFSATFSPKYTDIFSSSRNSLASSLIALKDHKSVKIGLLSWLSSLEGVDRVTSQKNVLLCWKKVSKSMENVELTIEGTGAVVTDVEYQLLFLFLVGR